MTVFKRLFLTITFMASISLLTACESVDTAVADFKDKFATIDFKMPEVTPREDGGTYAINDDQDPSEFASAEYILREDVKTVDTSHRTPITEIEPAAGVEEGEYNNLELSQEPFNKSIQPEDILRAKSIKITNSGKCPKVSVVSELNAMHQFANPQKPSPRSKISSITLTELKSSCNTEDDNLIVTLDLTFVGKLGPKARIRENDRPSFAYPYFLAVTSNQGNIVAKEVFAATVKYETGEDNIIHTETLRQIIPQDGNVSKKHEILLGFQLSEGELAYNRSLTSPNNFTYKGVPPQKIETSAGREEIKPISIKPPHKPKGLLVKKQDIQNSKKITDVVEEVTSVPVEEVENKELEEPSKIETGHTEPKQKPTLNEAEIVKKVKPVMMEKAEDEGLQIEFVDDKQSQPPAIAKPVLSQQQDSQVIDLTAED